ncbi:hypothetical protein FF1_044221 [Malus domestica]
MGALLRLAGPKSERNECHEISQNDTCKRQRMSPCTFEESQRLIPNLPDELSIQIIARFPRICYFNIRLVSRKWKETVTSSELFKLRKELGTSEEWLYLLTKIEEDKLSWHTFDPLSRRWQRLPQMPNVVYEEEFSKSSSRFSMWNMVGPSIKIDHTIRGWLGRKNAFERMLFCGGFYKATTVRCVWRFDPIQNAWSGVTIMSASRAYCKTGILNNKLYVVGGVTRERGGLIPLQSAEVFEPSTGTWSEVPSMPFSRARALPTAFLTDMEGYTGELYAARRLS